MNQEQVKEKLLLLEIKTPDFKVIFSGKKSLKVDGLYHPETKEIIIHNKNHNDNNQLMYTAIHEFAHHIQFTASPVPISAKSHTTHFWNIFHTLLYKAEELKIYNNFFTTNGEFVALTMKIKAEFLSENGRLMKEFGKLLLKASQLCQKHNASFSDYLDRILNIPRSSARAIMKVQALNICPDIGFENMKTVASIKKDESRFQAEQAFIKGQSPDMVKTRFTKNPEPNDPIEVLNKEKSQIERRILSLKQKLTEINKRINTIKQEEKL